MLSNQSIVLTSLLVSLFVGCHSAPPVGTATAGFRVGTSHSPPLQQTRKAVAPVVLAAFEEPEVLSVPPSDNSQLVLTLADLERLAFQNNPTLAAAAARMDAAGGRQVQAGLYPNPVVGYHATEIGNLGTAGQQGAFISQRFVTAGKLRLDQAIAAKEVDEAHFRLHAQELRVLSDVRIRFYEALVAQRRVELAEELAGIGDDLVAATERLLESRLRTENDLLQAQIKADESHILFANAGNQKVEAERRLAAVVGAATMEMPSLSGNLEDDLPRLDWDQSYALVLACNPELMAAQTRVERASLALQRAKREPIPNVDLSVSHRHHNVTQDKVTNVQVGIPLPIFDDNRGNLRSAEAEWTVAANEVGRIELDLQDRLAAAYRRYANARFQVDRYGERVLPNAERSLQLVRAGYEDGQVDYLTLLTAQQTYLQVNVSYLDSLRELRTAAAAIEGQLLTGSLAMNR